MKTLLAAVGLLTRIPVPVGADPRTAGKATGWFPLIGALIGGIYLALAALAAPRLPPAVIAVLLVITEALLTGALHMDGLADTADGFGGGSSPSEILCIMRDPAIGSYGATALVLLIAFKIAAYTALLARHAAFPYLLLASVLGRWTPAPLARILPYARPEKSAPAFVGTRELVLSTALAAVICLAASPRAALFCSAAVVASTTAFGAFCRRKIAGITGDTLGAAIEIAECAVLLVALLH